MPPLVKDMTPSGRKALTSALVICVLTGAITGTLAAHLLKPTPTHDVADRTSPIATTTTQFTQLYDTDPFAGIELEAQAAYVYDINADNVLFAKNATTSRPLASITKIMTAVTAAEEVPDYTVVPIKSEFLALDGNNGLYGMERWKMDALLDFSLVSSSNDGMAAVASTVGSTIKGSSSSTAQVQSFVDMMNEKTKEIGLSDTRFLNPHGLDKNDTKSGSYSTARDTARLMSYALRNHYATLEPTRFSRIQLTSLSDKTHTAENTNEVITKIPGILASKTGYTDLSGGNLAVVFDAGLNRPVVAVVLGSTYEQRFDDMLQLVDATITAYAAQGIESP